MAIKIDMLRCFLTVADRGNLSDAAKELGRTPSAVSMMLQQLEDHIGAPLFKPGRKSHLTRLGDLVRIEAKRELNHFDRTVAAIEGLSRAEAGHVRLAVTPSVAKVLMPHVLRSFANHHPDVRIDMRDIDSASIGHELQAGRVDIALASLRPLPRFERHLLFSDRFGVICPADHPLTKNWDDLGWSDLQDTPFIANDLGQLIPDPEFRRIQDSATLHVRNTASILSLVRAGMGVTVLPELAAFDAGDDLTFLPLSDKTLRREIWMLTPPDQDMSPAAVALTEVIRNQNIRLAHV
ncbi:LysR family transcriptional regulator [Roseovarius rhodophyticola]|uniref:LysR family transcriptional regulator n=1 Tax=Roseovarius rhodophyticola TaxID=3080827 RepID=A0ABZ2THT6_9RHOB|nr:LysR family transcriptional regulator [Roseovarius sp. W115]MDV2931067.1 LysR family transcriptional regulator [Roseovarius sp. W115]